MAAASQLDSGLALQAAGEVAERAQSEGPPDSVTQLSYLILWQLQVQICLTQAGSASKLTERAYLGIPPDADTSSYCT